MPKRTETPTPTLDALRLAARAVVDSADDTGCTDDLTVVNAQAMIRMELLLDRLDKEADHGV